ncbi:MAG: hypothetical protein ACXWC5_26730, partial [Burkholderiales bacterium]
MDSKYLDPDKLSALRATPHVARELLLAPSRIVATAGKYTVIFGPFDRPPLATARVIMVGLTPGLQQLEIANNTAGEADRAGITDPAAIETLIRARAAFAGSMRKNLITMLDELELPRFLCISSTSELFGINSDLLYATSALRYPVFVGPEMRNFGGSPKMMREPLFQEMVEMLLAPPLDAMPDSLVLPLGLAVENALDWLIQHGLLIADRVIRGFPHPSGANGHRLAHFRKNMTSLK